MLNPAAVLVLLLVQHACWSAGQAGDDICDPFSVDPAPLLQQEYALNGVNLTVASAGISVCRILQRQTVHRYYYAFRVAEDSAVFASTCGWPSRSDVLST